MARKYSSSTGAAKKTKQRKRDKTLQSGKRRKDVTLRRSLARKRSGSEEIRPSAAPLHKLGKEYPLSIGLLPAWSKLNPNRTDQRMVSLASIPIRDVPTPTPTKIR
jgi:hypothetical protein